MRTRASLHDTPDPKAAAPGPPSKGSESQMTVIIDETALKEHMQNNPGYSVRPKQNAPAEAAEEEEVLVVLPDEIDDVDTPTEELVLPRGMHASAANRAEEVGLLGMDPTAAAEAHIDPASVPVTLNPVLPADELPNLEVVEDITSLIDKNPRAPLEALDSSGLIVQDHEPASSGRGFPWFKLTAAIALIACGVSFGPDLYRKYVSHAPAKITKSNKVTKPETPVGGTTPGTTVTSTPGVVEVEPGSGGAPPPLDPVGTEPMSHGTPTPVAGTASTAQLAEFRSWVSGALARNLGEPATPSGQK